jgi:prolyl-tRNA editing enzyme YbaK/EbsC (Cys-tRNA(Pro) deacylase)
MSGGMGSDRGGQAVNPAAPAGAPAAAVETDDAASQRPEGFRRVAAALAALGHPHAPRWLEMPARTSAEAARALGVSVGQIAKSVVFRRVADDRAVLVVASGDRRVDEARVAALAGPLARADAAFVKAATGFSIGGVAPLAHATPPLTLLDRTLWRFDALWAAAGHPNGVFRLAPDDLLHLAEGAQLADVALEPAAGHA